MDGTPTNRCAEFVAESLLKGTVDHGSTAAATSELPAPTEVDFKLNGSIEKALDKAAARFDADVARHDHHVLSTAWTRFKK